MANMSVLHLPRSVYRDLRAHGEEAWPHECCGALLGRAFGGPDGWQVESLMRTTNARADSAHNRYEIAPRIWPASCLRRATGSRDRRLLPLPPGPPR